MMQMNLQSKKRFADFRNKFTVGRGQDDGEGIVRELGTDMCSLLCLKWITSKDLLYSTENSAQCHVIAWMG